MLHELVIQGEDARWETFKKAEREAQRREALRESNEGGRVRKLARRVTQRSPQFAVPQAGPAELEGLR